MRTAPTDLQITLDDRDAPVVLGGHHGRPLPGRPGTDHDDVKLIHVAMVSFFVFRLCVVARSFMNLSHRCGNLVH
jgi:hypothetical protein